ncbi:CDP-glycerol glycerophosphotransferase family protein [Microbispora sp. RL4-1S]|uniref:CDP-glycerol glycerophosphotransferase family protein n=1 Tax=Microbispora oryzae TaxID=2806554 RepID=A0A940WQ07_9ACTN|nr:bifunctional glycosyltransferase/CDP-glycerol:glycerophosphate glycerophosphotransferase [Microbispora oryzae]MBP2704799.1 CDP-glycerol glycerophosphotransferase family protein [Microbispora oryzae]
MTEPPRLSVVVPLRGRREHIEECLTSLRSPTPRDLEVVLVADEGAPRLSAAGPAFRLVTVPHGTDAAAARNAGAAHATGVHLAFADPRRVVPEGAHLRLAEALETTGSDLACGVSRRLGGRARGPGREADVLRTHVRDRPGLLRDTSAATKVFRREFWDRHGLSFAAGLEDDVPVTVPALVLAEATDVLGEVVCLTRPGVREPAGEPARVLAALLDAGELVARHAPGLRPAYDRQVTESAAFRAALDTAPAGTLAPLATGLGRLCREAVDGLPALRRLQLHLARHGMAAELDLIREFAEHEIRDRGVLRRGPLRRRVMDYPLRGDRRLPARLFDAGNDLRLHARLDDVRLREGRLRLAGYAYIAHLGSGGSRIELWLGRKDERVALPVRRIHRPEATAGSGQSVVCHDESGFETEIDLGRLPRGRWTLHARVRAGGVTRTGPVTAARDMGEREFRADGFDVVLTRDRGLVLRAAAGDPPEEETGGPLVTGLRWTKAGELVLTGTGPAARIVLERGGERHSWPATTREGRWTATIGRTAAGPPPRSGTWRISAGGVAVRLREAFVADPPAPHVTGTHEVRVRTTRDADLMLVIRPALGPDERGPYATRRRRAAPRPAGPLRNAALFDSYGGGQYSCNPRAVSEELGRHDPGVELVWVTRDGQFTVPDGVRTVLYGSRAHEEALRTSRFVVANRRTQPSWYAKPPGQLFVQTWHGTPLKRLGLDARDMPHAQRVPADDLRRQAGTWDVLISPNPFSTPILSRAFGYEGEMLESGYPRNDALLRPGRRRAARRALGLPEDRRAVLYAPTWRDDEVGRPGRLRLDVGRVAAALDPDAVLLVRAHYLVADDLDIPPEVLDVSRFPDMADLLAAADVLVTDYSSAMFDFAVTGRPMVFFADDLERYRDEVRGFYFDFAARAPGPVVRTAGEVAEAVEAVAYGDAASAYKARYDAFARDFCPWDDGQAAGRVVARMTRSPR